MAGTREAGLNAAADAVADLIAGVRAYEGDPDAAGAPVSPEVAVGFDPAVASIASLTAAVDLAVAADSTVNHMVFLDAVDAVVTSGPVTAEVFVNAGTYRLTGWNIDANVGV